MWFEIRGSSSFLFEFWFEHSLPKKFHFLQRLPRCSRLDCIPQLRCDLTIQTSITMWKEFTGLLHTIGDNTFLFTWFRLSRGLKFLLLPWLKPLPYCGTSLDSFLERRSIWKGQEKEDTLPLNGPLHDTQNIEVFDLCEIFGNSWFQWKWSPGLVPDRKLVRYDDQ